MSSATAVVRSGHVELKITLKPSWLSKPLMEALVLSTQRAQQNRDDDASVARALADELTLAAGTVVGAFGPGVLGLMEAAPPTTLEKDGVFHPLAMASEWL